MKRFLLILAIFSCFQLSSAMRYTHSATFGPVYVNTRTLTADFEADSLEVIVGHSIQFTDLTGSDAISWKWDFQNDGIVDSWLQNPAFSYGSPGVYSVALTVSNGIDSTVVVKSDYITVQAPFVSFTYHPTEVDFAACFVDSVYYDTIVLSNEGTIAGVLSELGMNGHEFFSYAIEDGITSVDFPLTIAAGDSIVVKIKYHPLEEGVHSTQLYALDEVGWSAFIDIYGSADAYPQPIINVHPYVLTHTMQENTVSIRDIEIHNNGTMALQYTIPTDSLPSWLTLNSNSGTVAADSYETLYLSFNSAGLPAHPVGTIHADGYLYSLRIDSNDPVTPSYFYNIQLLVVSQQLVVDFVGSPTSGSAPLTVRFTDLTTISQDFGTASISSWRWDFNNDGIVDSWLRHPTFTYQIPGVFSVKLSVTSNTGIIRSTVKQNYITIQNAAPVVQNPINNINDMYEDTIWGPYPLLHSEINPNGIFSDPNADPLIFSATNSANICVNISGGFFSLSSTLDFNGSEVITLMATDTFGQSVSHNITVNIIPVNDAPVLSLPANLYFIRNSHFSVDFAQYFNDPDNPDSEVSIHITALSTLSNIDVAYTPDVPGVHLAVFSAPLNWIGTENFQLSVNDHTGRAIATADFAMTVLQHFDAEFAVNSGGSATVAYAGQTVTFSDNTLGNPDWWVWEIFRNGAPYATNSNQNPSLTLTQAGSYDVRLTLGNNEANEQDFQFIPGIFTLSGTSVTDGSIPENWNPAGSPYNVFGDFSIPQSQVIEIEENVVVNVFSEQPIAIQGTMLATNAVFQPQTDTGFWEGMVFSGNPRRSSSINNCQVINARNPIQVIGGTPSLTNLYIAPADTLQMLPGTAITLIGDVMPVIDNLDIVGYQTGISFLGTSSNPTLSNIRIRNSSSNTRHDEESAGVKIDGDSDVELENIEIVDYKTGLEIDARDSNSTPTLTNIRVRSSETSSRSLFTGLLVRGNSAFLASEIIIEDVSTGIVFMEAEARFRDTPVLSNVRIRSSTAGSRSESVAMILDNVASLQMDDMQCEGFTEGIRISADALRTLSTPSLTNIRIRSTNTGSRSESVGLKATGAVLLSLNDVEIEGYQYGIKYDTGNTELATNTPTLTNIRIVNSSSGSRNTSFGIQIYNQKKVSLSDVEIEGCTVGVEIMNTEHTVSTSPTLSNIRVQNSNTGARSENIGIHLSNLVGGKLMNSEIKQAGIGILIADGNSTELSYNKIVNCETGIRASGIEPPRAIQTQSIILDNAYFLANPALDFRAFQLYYNGPWQISQNSILGYPSAVKAQAATVVFTNNIAWRYGYTMSSPFTLTSGIIFPSYNNIAYIAGAYPGLGNINSNPLFIDPAMYDLSLHYNSPCIDAGNPLILNSDGSYSDIGAFTYLHRAWQSPSARFVQTGTTVNFTNQSWGHGYPETVVSWDLNNDGTVESNAWDFSYLFDAPGMYDLRLTLSTGNLVDTRLYRAIVVAGSVALKAPGNPHISKIGSHIYLTWDAVTSTVQNDPINVTHYIVYRSDTPYGIYDFVGFTENGTTNYAHVGAASHPQSFYFIIGFTGSREELMRYISGRGATQRK